MSQPLLLQLTETAEEDLAEVWAYLASEASEATATRIIGAIEQAFTALRYTPGAGARREHLASGLRVLLHAPYAVYYLATDRHVTIVRVLHSARDIDAIAEQGGFIG